MAEAAAAAHSPWWLRIPTLLVGIYPVAAIPTVIRNRGPLYSLIYLILFVHALVGTWQMKRWAVLLLVGLGGVHVVLATIASGPSWHGPLGVVLLYALVVVPSSACWRRMRWR